MRGEANDISLRYIGELFDIAPKPAICSAKQG